MADLLKTFDLTPLDLQMIIIWAFCFVALWQVLARTLFGPYIKLAEAREAVTSGAGENARVVTTKAQELSAKYEDRMTQARVAGMKEKIAILNKYRAEAQAIIDAAEKNAQAKIKRNKEEVASRLRALKAELERESNAMVEMITQKVKSIGSATTGGQR